MEYTQHIKITKDQIRKLRDNKVHKETAEDKAAKKMREIWNNQKIWRY